MQEFRIPFKGWDLVAWINEQASEQLVAVRPIAEAIGVEWARQAKKLQSDPRFSCTHMYTTGADGRRYEMLTLPVKQLNGWLYGINANKVKPDVREKLLVFQEECLVAIYNHMSGRANEKVVALLKELVIKLQSVVESQQREIAELKARGQIYDQMLGLEASVAGQRLRAARQLRVVQ